MRGTWMEYAVHATPARRGIDPELVVFLHGGGDGPESLARAGVLARIDDKVEGGELAPMVIISPRGDLGFWANWYDGSRRYEDWIVDELMPRIARRRETAACPEHCHLLGVSMGAEGALRIAVHRPDAFASVSAISGPALDTARRLEFARDPMIQTVVPVRHVFGPDDEAWVSRDDPFRVWRGPDDVRTRLLIAWGDEDRSFVREGSEALDAHLTSVGIPHRALAFRGHHAWASWRDVIVDVLSIQAPAPRD